MKAMSAPTLLFPMRAAAGPAALFAALSLAVALTEGIGLLMLAPLLGALGAEPAGGGPIVALAARVGLPVELAPLLALFAGLVALRGAIVLGRTLAAQALEVAVVDHLRRRAWRSLLLAEWRHLAQLRRSESASLLISNIDRIGYGLNQLLAALSAAAVLGALGLAALALSPIGALGGALGAMLVLAVFRRLRRRAGALGESLGAAYAAVHHGFGESLGALRAIKSQGAEGQAEDRALAGVEALRQAQRRYLLSHGLGQLALQAGGALALALLVWLAFSRWHFAAATIVPLVALLGRALPVLGGLQEAWQNWCHARPALDSARALIEAAEAARELPGEAPTGPCFERDLRLEEVSVRFAGEPRPALVDVDLTLPARGMMALIGPSGAGKSTLADLAGGLLSPDAGCIRLDGVRLEGALRQAWRSRVAYVHQDPAVVAGTVRENLLWGAPRVEEAVLQVALRDASAEFVHALPQGLETRLGDGGRILSGGERQRLMLARALLRDPALLILDEATSALDPVNEAAIADAIARLKTRMAVLVIAHRGALTALADQVVTLEAGRIAAISRMNAGQ